MGEAKYFLPGQIVSPTHRSDEDTSNTIPSGLDRSTDQIAAALAEKEALRQRCLGRVPNKLQRTVRSATSDVASPADRDLTS